MGSGCVELCSSDELGMVCVSPVVPNSTVPSASTATAAISPASGGTVVGASEVDADAPISPEVSVFGLSRTTSLTDTISLAAQFPKIQQSKSKTAVFREERLRALG